MADTSRFKRFAKLASMSARMSAGVAARGLKRFSGSDESILSAASAEKLVATLGDLKGLAMKMGQAMSMDPDLVTPEIRAIISKLQNDAPSMDATTVRGVIEKELGAPLAERFGEFSDEPLAAASLGQVHAATLLDGTPVAVKVQYPDIDLSVAADFDNIGVVVNAVSAGVRVKEGREYFDEFKQSIVAELDYRTEAQNAVEFAAAAARVSGLVVPRMFGTHSSQRVLTMERLEGETLKQFLSRAPAASNDERFAVARQLIRAMWGPFLAAGVVHGDPHPGNFILMSGGRFGVLDFGNVKKTSPAFHRVNTELFLAPVRGGYGDLLHLSEQSGFVFNVGPEEARPFVKAVVDVAARHLTTRDYDFSTGSAAREMREFFLKNAMTARHIRPPKEAVVFFRAMGGLLQNLQTLGARGDYVGVHQELGRDLGLLDSANSTRPRIG